MRNTFGMLAGLVIALAVSPPWSRAVSFTHQGSQDPTGEGWTLDQVGQGSAGAIQNDLGIASWFLSDLTGSGRISYSRPLDGVQLEEALQNGWKLHVSARVVAQSGLNSVGFGFETGVLANNVYLNLSGENTLVYYSGQNGPTELVVPGTGYHDFVLAYDPSNSIVSFRIDEVEQAGLLSIDYFTGTPGVWWGAGSTQGIGEGNFSYFEFATVPKAINSVPETISSGVAAGSLLAALLVGAFLRKHGMVGSP